MMLIVGLFVLFDAVIGTQIALALHDLEKHNSK